MRNFLALPVSPVANNHNQAYTIQKMTFSIIPCKVQVQLKALVFTVLLSSLHRKQA